MVSPLPFSSLTPRMLLSVFAVSFAPLVLLDLADSKLLASRILLDLAGIPRLDRTEIAHHARIDLNRPIANRTAGNLFLAALGTDRRRAHVLLLHHLLVVPGRVDKHTHRIGHEVQDAERVGNGKQVERRRTK